MEYTLYGLLVALLTLFLTHRLFLCREQRKEYNDAVLPIRNWLIKEAIKPSPYSKPPSMLEIDMFVHCLSIRKQREFLKAYALQQEERKKVETRDKSGGVFYRDESIIIDAVNMCLKYTNKQ